MNSLNKNSAIELYNLLDKGINEKDAILKQLNIKAPSFYKNIQKLKSAGFKISKKDNKYILKQYKNILDISNIDKSTIAYMINIAAFLLPDYKYKNFNDFLNKFLILGYEADYFEIIKKFELIKKYNELEEFEEKINTLEYYILKNQPAKITLYSNKEFIIKPFRFDWKKKDIELYFIDKSQNSSEKLKLKQIAKIEKVKEKSNLAKNEEIIFELYGALAKRYLLKEGERIVKNAKNSIVVASFANDKEELYKRLLRYDTMCKILFPKYEAEMFNKLIDKAIINIDLEGSNE